MNEENRKWLERLIKENKDSPNELTYTYCPFEVLYQLQQENQQLKIEISAREEEYKKLEDKYIHNVPCCNEDDCDLYRNYMELEDNWNKLKEYIEKTKIKEFEKSYGKRYGKIYGKTFKQAEIIVCNMIKDKIKELERGIDNE